MSTYTPLGYGRVFRDPRTGDIVVDEDSIGRRGFQGEFGYAPAATDYDDGPGYEGYDEDDEDDEDDVPAYGAAPDDAPIYSGDEFYIDEFGALRRKRRKKGRGRGRGRGRTSSPQRASRRQSAPRPASTRAIVPASRQGLAVSSDMPSDKGMTALSGSTTLTDPGTATITIRAQHAFEATDVTFEGSVSGAKITGISFGPNTVLTAPDGISTSVFTPTSQMRKMLEGQRLDAGLDIVVTGTLPEAGSLNAVFFGRKPMAGS